MDSIKIYINRAGVKKRWDDFDKEKMLIGNSMAYKEYQRSMFLKTICLEAYENDKKVGQWLLFYKYCFRDKYIFTHSFPTISETYSYNDVFKAMLNHLKLIYKGMRLELYDYALIRNTNKQILEDNGFIDIHMYSSYLSELKDNEENLMLFHASHRNDTKKAIRENYRYCNTISEQEYIYLSNETYRRSNAKGISLYDVKKLKKRFKDHFLMSGVYFGDKLQAASIVLMWGNYAVYLHGASSTKKVRGATTFLQYKNMEYVFSKGIKYYDFTGAKIDDAGDNSKANSLDAFKRRFGGKMSINYSGKLYL